MWNALRSDFKEFASSIATDGNAIRENIETKLVVDADTDTDTDYDAALQDNEYDADQDQSNMNDMIIGENGEVEYMHKDDNDNDSNNDNGNEGDVKDEVIDEAIRRADDEETYLTPLLINEVNGVNGVIGIGSEESQNDEIVDADVDTDVATSQKEEAEEEGEEGNVENTEDDGGEEGWGDGQDPSFETVQEEEPGPSTAAVAAPNTVQEQDILDTDINNVTDDSLAEATTMDMDANTNIEIDTAAQPSFAPVLEQILIPIDPKDDPAIIAFLSTFTLQPKTQEIGEILADSPDTTCKHFDNLVPQFVSYEQFWQRYYYRCDPERIQREWEEEEVRERIRRMELIENGKKRVQDLFGGALKSIIKGSSGGVGGGFGDGMIRGSGSGSDVKEESIYEKYQAELEEKRRALQDGSGHSGEGSGTGTGASIVDEKDRKIGGLGGIFGRVRPPFVMNTAVDDDDDEEEDEEYDAAQDEKNHSDHDDDEEAEEDDDFGWGSDEDDEEDDDGVSNGSQEDGDSEGTEEVVFSSPDPDTDPNTDKSGSAETKNLRQELDEALKLKEELERTIELQEQQLKTSGSALQLQEESSALQEGVVAAKDDIGSAAAATAEVKRLELALFEKNSELAALKAIREDTDGEHEERESEAIDELKAEIIRLISELGKKEEQFDKLRENLKKVEALQDKEDATDNEMLAEALETINSLQADLEQCSADARQHLEEMDDRYQDELDGLREEITKLETEQATNAEQEKALKDSTELIYSLQSQLEASSNDLSIVQEEVVSLKVLHEEQVFKDKDALAEAAENMASLQTELQDTKDKLAATAPSELEESTSISDELRDKNEIISALNSELEEVKAHLTLKEDADEIDQDSATDAREMISSLQLELERSYAEVASAKDATQVEIDACQASEGNVASLQSKLEAARAELGIVLSTKDEESANGNAALDDAIKALAVLQSELEMAKVESNSLQDEMASKEAAVIEFKKTYTEANEIITALNVKLEETKSAAESQISIARAQLEASTKESNDAKKLLEGEVKNLLAKVRIFESEKGNEARKVETSIQDLDDDKRIGETVAAPPSHNEEGSSFSSGVDVNSPIRTDVKGNGDEDEDEDGGWGEDWSDDEEV